MQHFKISEGEIKAIIAESLKYGADYADIYFEHSSTLSVSLQNEDDNKASQNIDFGAGVRVVSGEKTGYAYTEEVSLPALMNAARQAARICQGDQPIVKVANFHPIVPLKTFYRNRDLDLQPSEQQIEELVVYLKELREQLLEADSRIVNTSGSIIHKVRRFAIANSLGDCYEEEQPITNISVGSVIAHEGRTERASCSRSFRRTLDMLTSSLQKELVGQCVRKLHFALTAIQPTGGEMPVVMGAGASGILLHEAIGHAFEADFIRRGESIFTDSLDKQICDPDITVVDDGTLPDFRGTIHVDDEGVPSQCTAIVTEGRLTSFLHDRISARHFGVAPTGNGRRESFRHMPVPRMRNTYMLSGHSTESDLIASVKKGIFVDDFSNGQVQIGAGDYSFFVKGGYLIENGHLTQPVKDINIIGNGPRTLSDIHGVANNLVVDPSTWTCGKEGQSCPVSCGMPSVLVEKLTVG
ncbi:MAG: TldD/PmbA family protein [Bacteroidales bacterium]|nr:TldD/PmbA family protein [Bacteroidales bacterium]